MTSKFYFKKSRAQEARKTGQRVVKRKLKNGKGVFVIRRARK